MWVLRAIVCRLSSGFERRGLFGGTAGSYLVGREAGSSSDEFLEF